MYLHEHIANSFLTYLFSGAQHLHFWSFLFIFSLSFHSFLKHDTLLISTSHFYLDVPPSILAWHRHKFVCMHTSHTTHPSERSSFFPSICKTKYRESIWHCMCLYICICVCYCVYLSTRARTHTHAFGWVLEWIQISSKGHKNTSQQGVKETELFLRL